MIMTAQLKTVCWSSMKHSYMRPSWIGNTYSRNGVHKNNTKQSNWLANVYVCDRLNGCYGGKCYGPNCFYVCVYRSGFIITVKYLFQFFFAVLLSILTIKKHSKYILIALFEVTYSSFSFSNFFQVSWEVGKHLVYIALHVKENRSTVSVRCSRQDVSGFSWISWVCSQVHLFLPLGHRLQNVRSE